MSYAHPDILLWLWLAPLALLLTWQAWRRRQARIAVFYARGPRQLGFSSRRAALKMALMTIAVASLVLAWAQPRLGFEWADVKRRGVDLVVAVDVSNSMLAADINPSRIERAKRKLQDLLDTLGGDRIGLVAFAGDAFVQCPLTQDYAAVRMFLNYLDPALIPVQGTDINKAVRESLKALQEGGENNKELAGSQAIILITDGEDLSGQVSDAVRLAKDAGIRLYTMAVGSEQGAPIPDADGSFKKDQAGNLIITKSDEASLTKLAIDTGGMFVRSVTSSEDIVSLYRDGIKRELSDNELKESRERVWYERYQWFVGLAILVLIVDMLLKDYRMVTGALVALLLGVTGLAPDVLAQGSKQAFDAYQKGQYGAAAKGFLADEIEDPDDAAVAYNRAVSQFRNRDYQGAAQGFKKAADKARSRADGKALAAQSLYNQGNSLVGVGDLDAAIAAYEEALNITPEDKRIAENLEAVKKLRDQPPPPPQQQSDDQKDKQDQQDQQQQQQQQQSQQQQEQQQAGQQQQDQQQNQQQQSPEQQQGQPQSQQQQGQSQDQQQQGQDQQAPAGDQPKPETANSGEQPEGSGEQEKPSGQESAGQKPQAKGAAPISQQQAEDILRGAEDKVGRFLFAPKDKQPPKKPEKDW